MTNKYTSIILGLMLIAGCASVTPESVTKGHKIYREEIIDRSLKEVFETANIHLGTCFKAIGETVSTLYGDSGPLLTATTSSGSDYQEILLGNPLRGGTQYFKFSDYNGITKLEGYSKEGYSVAIEQFNNYIESVVNQDISLCN